MEEKNIKITINVECSEKSSVKKEQIAGYLLRAIAGVTANNKCLITNYVCEINEKNDDCQCLDAASRALCGGQDNGCNN